jgi:hypothetical protein
VIHAQQDTQILNCGHKSLYTADPPMQQCISSPPFSYTTREAILHTQGCHPYTPKRVPTPLPLPHHLNVIYISHSMTYTKHCHVPPHPSTLYAQSRVERSILMHACRKVREHKNHLPRPLSPRLVELRK